MVNQGRGARPSLIHADRGSRVFLLAVALAIALAGVVALLGAGPLLVDLLVVPPLLAAAGAGWRGTAAVGFCAVALAALVSLAGDGLEGRHGIALITVALGAVLAIWIAALRERREKDSARLQIQYAAARVLSEAESLEAGIPRMLEAVGRPLGWETAGFWQLQEDGALRCEGFWSAPGVDSDEFERVSREMVFRPGVGLPGRVLERGEPVWVLEVGAERNFPRAPYAERAGLLAGAGFPVAGTDGTTGVIEFFSRRLARRDEELTHFMATLAIQVGEFLDRLRAEEERGRLLQLEQVARLGAVQARDQLEAILGGVADGVIARTPDGRLLFANDAAVRALGYGSAEELMAAPRGEARDRFEIFDEDGRPLTGDQLPGQVAATSGGSSDALIHFRVKRTGEEHWSLVKSTPVVDEDGDVLMAITVMEDITDQKRSELREQFLSESTRVLASSLDPDETLQRVASLAVPDVADWCVVDLAGRGGIDRVALAHADPGQVERARVFQERYPPDPTGTTGVPNVLRTGRSELYPEIPDELLEQGAVDEEHLELIRSFGLRSAMIAPMTARGRVLGAMTFVSGPSGRRFDEHDLALVEELARRGAVAIDNAHVFGERDTIAQTLQRSLLPAELPDILGFETGARYHASGRGTEVGGDFYDLFESREGGWTVVVGDVCGKGPEAAAITALARYTLRAAAMREQLPSRILRLLNEALLRQRSDRRFCTVAFAQIEQVDGGARVGMASGGHPLPLVLRADGRVEELGAPGTLLGAFPDPSLGDSSATLAAGDALVFYTDGVTEARGADGSLDEDALRRLLASCAGLRADAIAERVEAAAVEVQSGRPRDDIAVVVLRVSPE